MVTSVGLGEAHMVALQQISPLIVTLIIIIIIHFIYRALFQILKDTITTTNGRHWLLTHRLFHGHMKVKWRITNYYLPTSPWDYLFKLSMLKVQCVIFGLIVKLVQSLQANRGGGEPWVTRKTRG